MFIDKKKIKLITCLPFEPLTNLSEMSVELRRASQNELLRISNTSTLFEAMTEWVKTYGNEELDLASETPCHEEVIAYFAKYAIIGSNESGKQAHLTEKDYEKLLSQVAFHNIIVIAHRFRS
jgi:hypothetical protein